MIIVKHKELFYFYLSFIYIYFCNILYINKIFISKYQFKNVIVAVKTSLSIRYNDKYLTEFKWIIIVHLHLTYNKNQKTIR